MGAIGPSVPVSYDYRLYGAPATVYCDSVTLISASIILIIKGDSFFFVRHGAVAPVRYRSSFILVRCNTAASAAAAARVACQSSAPRQVPAVAPRGSSRHSVTFHIYLPLRSRVSNNKQTQGRRRGKTYTECSHGRNARRNGQCSAVIIFTVRSAGEAAVQCIVIVPVCLCVCLFGCLWVCYHENTKLRASILTKLGL